MWKRTLALVFVIAMSPALWAQTKVKPGFNLMSLKQDVEIGRQSASEIERQLPMLRNATVNRYVSKVGKRLASVIQGPDFPYQFKVANQATINAFALPGGFMYINRGLIEAAENEAELAGVMAHEMAHVALRHGTNRVSKAYLAQAGLGALGAVLGGGSGIGWQQIISSAGGFGLNALFLKFSRKAETQSDVVGTQMLHRAGYNPMSMADFFETLRRESGKDPGKMEQFFSSHPAPKNRAARVREEIQQLGKGRQRSQVGGFDQVRTVLRGLPKAPSPKKQATSGTSAPPPRDEGGQRPAQVKIERPSSRLRLFEQRNGFFRIRYPENWRPLESRQGASVTLLPEGGMLEGNRGEQSIVYGLIVNHFDPSQQDAEKSARGPFRGRDQLERASNDLIQMLLEGNQYLGQVRRSARDELIDGDRALSVTLRGRSPVTGEKERVIVFTRALPNDHLVYMLFIAPDRRYSELKKIITRMLSSFSVNDAALPG